MQKYAPIHLSNSVERSPFLVSQPCNAHRETFWVDEASFGSRN